MIKSAPLARLRARADFELGKISGRYSNRLEAPFARGESDYFAFALVGSVAMTSVNFLINSWSNVFTSQW